MNIIIAKDYDEACDIAANEIKSVVAAKPNAVLGLATGSTQLGVYKRLAELYRRGELSFKDCVTFNLDEYVGAGANDEYGYAYYMDKNLFSLADFNAQKTHLPIGTAERLDDECERYSALLARSPRDIQLLGLGSDGHIGFNEPQTPFDIKTHVAELAESTVSDNARLFGNIDEVPRRAITMGIAEILQAKKIAILATGAAKARAVFGMVKGEITEACPASALQRHGNTDVILDVAAASLLERI